MGEEHNISLSEVLKMDSRNHNFGLQNFFCLHRGGGPGGEVKLLTFFFLEGFPKWAGF